MRINPDIHTEMHYNPTVKSHRHRENLFKQEKSDLSHMPELLENYQQILQQRRCRPEEWDNVFKVPKKRKTVKNEHSIWQNYPSELKEK